MSMTRTGTVAPTITIIGKDLEAEATFNADTVPALGVLKAGTVMKYTVATRLLEKCVLGTDVPFGILADDVDTGAAGATEVPIVMIYRGGTFLRQEIESANNTAIGPGSALDLSLRDMGIYLELSYDDYDGLSPVPAGVEHNVATPEEAAAVEAADAAAAKAAESQPPPANP